jgi:endonuclease-3
MKKDNINKIFSIFSQANPYPETELKYINNYTLLVAVVLSAQSTDIGVNKATKKLFAIANNPKDMIKIGEEKLKKYINTIGLYNTKAKNVIALSNILIDKFDSKIPQDLDTLQTLPGVGRKTANVVLNCAFGFKTIGVDTHVFRVSNRIGLAKAKDVLKTEIALLKNIPEEWQQHAHHWLILHGRYTCTARNPKCQICIIKDLCKFKDKNI